MKNTSVIDKFFVSCGSDERLHAVLMLPARGSPERLICIVPLVGSRASQQIISFRNFTRTGAALLSFEYRGHGMSSGKFTMERSLEDTKHMLLWAAAFARSHGMPLHALSTCYSTLPLLSFFKGRTHDHGITTIGAISGLVDMRRILTYKDFSRYYTLSTGQCPVNEDDFLMRLENGLIDHDSHVFRRAISNYLKGLFPELHITENAFEELSYDRVEAAALLKQFGGFNPLNGVDVPDDIPCLFYYGVHDDLMGLNTSGGRERYESDIKTVVPHAEVRWGDFDHFGRGQDRERVFRHFCDFHRRNEHLTAAA